MENRLYRKESMFELALRLTQNIKQDEYFIMRYKESGEVYIDSMSVLNTIYENLSELGPEDAYHDFRVENLESSTQQGSPIDHYTFNGENYPVDWNNISDDDYCEFGR